MNPGSATSSRSAPPAGRSRTSRTTVSWSRPRSASPASSPSGRATPWAGRWTWAAPSARSCANWSASDVGPATERCKASGLDDYAANNLIQYLAEQRLATEVVPSDTTLVVERFHDELGDWRVVLHSPFGMPVHAPWALAVGQRLQQRYGMDGSAMAADDGIVLRVPMMEDEPPGAELFLFDPEEIEQIVTAEVGGSALFASRFRECAARALLLPRQNPGKRQPLWQQRQRSAQLLDVAGSTRRSRSSSRRSASACRMSTTFRR